MKNLASVQVVRGPGPQETAWTLTCPLCTGFRMKLTRTRDTLQQALGLPGTYWEPTTWEAEFSAHVNAHTPGQIVEKIYRWADEVENYRATIDNLNNFLDALREHAATESRRALVKRCEDRHIPIPEQLHDA